MFRTTILLCLLIAAVASAQQVENTDPVGPLSDQVAQGPPGDAAPGQRGGPPPGVPPGQRGGPPTGAVPPGGFPDGQAPPPWLIPRYRLLRDEEDWSYLANPAMRGHDWADPLKYI